MGHHATHIQKVKDVKQRRNLPHPFLAQQGHPELCVACNCTKDEKSRKTGNFIHTL